jgi:DNA-binding NtrC family response regulator
LVLEDDVDLLHLYTRALTYRGYEVICTNSAESAIDTLHDDRCMPDVAVLDMSMPGLPGSAVVDYIRHNSRCPNLPIIVISGNEDFREVVDWAGAQFMPKPINLSDLYRAVARCEVRSA